MRSDIHILPMQAQWATTAAGNSGPMIKYNIIQFRYSLTSHYRCIATQDTDTNKFVFEKTYTYSNKLIPNTNGTHTNFEKKIILP